MIRDAGGIVIVQDPLDAAFPELPTRALQALEPDQTLPIDAIGTAIAALVGDDAPVVALPQQVALEAEVEATANGHGLEVVVGEAVVRVGRGFDGELLQRVVVTLRASC